MEEQEIILSNARRRFMTEDIDAEDFKAIKAECTQALKVLEAQLSDLRNKADSLKTVENMLDIVIFRYSNIQLRYKSVSIIEKRKLIGSMYPKNLCFDGIGYLTPCLNTVLASILQINSKLLEKKKGEKYTMCNFPPLVEGRRQMSNFLEGLQAIISTNP